jgi:hypothetical protein
MAQQDHDRYIAATHAMQTGVAYELEIDPSGGTPKHLRVGVNSAMVEFSALVKLLIAKGVIDEAEFMKELADGMERERDSYQERLTAHYGRPVTLA